MCVMAFYFLFYSKLFSTFERASKKRSRWKQIHKLCVFLLNFHILRTEANAGLMGNEIYARVYYEFFVLSAVIRGMHA